MEINVAWKKFSKLQRPGALGHGRNCLSPRWSQAFLPHPSLLQPAGLRLLRVFWGHLGAETDVLPEVFLPIWRKNKRTAWVVKLVCLEMQGYWKLLPSHFFPQAPNHCGLAQLLSLVLQIKFQQQPPILLEICFLFKILVLLNLLAMLWGAAKSEPIWVGKEERVAIFYIFMYRNVHK